MKICANLCRLLTEIGRVVVFATLETQRGQERDEPLDGSLIDTLTLGEHIELVEHLKKKSAGLMDRADDGATLPSQVFQQRHTLIWSRTVQSTATGPFSCKSFFSFIQFLIIAQIWFLVKNKTNCKNYAEIKPTQWYRRRSYLVGSSKNITGGLFTSSWAMASRFRWPPDNCLILVNSDSLRPRASRIRLICKKIGAAG